MLSIQLADETERRLREAAERVRIPVDQLAAAAVRDFVTQPADDFEAAAKRVLEANRELYCPSHRCATSPSVRLAPSMAKCLSKPVAGVRDRGMNLEIEVGGGR